MENETIYKLWVESQDEKIIESKLDNMVLEFTNMKPNSKGRTRWQNVIKSPVGVRGSAQDATEPAWVFE